MHKGATLAIAAVVLGPVELFAKLGLVVLRDIVAFLQLVAAVRESTLKQNLN